MSDITERAQTVVDRHQHHALVGETIRVVVLAGVRRQDGKGAAMEPDYHRQIGSILGPGDVEVKRVSTHPALVDRFRRHILGRLMSPGYRFPYPGPGMGGN